MARKMKDSGIEWIGEIPEGWEVIRLKYLADFEPTCDTSYLTDESKVTYTPMECVKNGGFENRSALYGNLSHTLTPFQNGDIAMAKVTPCFENGNIAIMDNLFSGFGLGSSELFIFRPKGISIHYFFYWLQNKAFVAKACSTMTGTGGLKRISPSFIRNCPVHCPSMDEQTKISDYLKAKCTEIDTMLFKTRSSIEEYKKLKQAVITQAVTKGVRGEREMKDSGIEWIGTYPSNWKIIKIKWLLHERKDRSVTGLEEPLSMSQKKGLIPTKEMDSIPNMASSFIGAKLVYKGDLVFNKLKAHLGVFSVSKYNGLVSPDYAVYYSTGLANLNFLELLFKTPQYINEFKKKSSGVGAGLTRLYTGDLYSIYCALPPLVEQEEIADYLDIKCAEIDGLIAKKEQLVKELESYKKSLIYEVVTGKREV